MIKWELVNITPELAGKMLGKNDVNRKLREHRCAFIARAIDEGHWVTTHQAIAFSKSGRLLDGQHRLRSIIMANKAVEVWVATNVPEEAYSVMDSGLPRKMHERLNSDARRTTVATSLFRVAGPRSIPHEYEIQLMLEVFESAFTRLEGIPKITVNNKLNKASVQAAMVLRLATERAGSERHSYMLDSIAAYARGDVVLAPKVMVSLYRQMLEGVRDGGPGSSAEQFARAWYALDPDNSSVGKIQMKDLSAPISEARSAFKRATENVFDGG